MHDNKGDNHIIFLDTGAIIDIDTWVRRYRIKDKSHTVHSWYDAIEKDKTVLLTPLVLEEVMQHHIYHKINGIPEISKESIAYAEKYFTNFQNFYSKLSHPESIDNVRYDAYWATKLAFDDDQKKGEIDQISRTDIDLLISSIEVKHSLDDNLREISDVTVISPDRHIHDTLNLLSGRHHKYDANYTEFDYKNIEALCLRK